MKYEVMQAGYDIADPNSVNVIFCNIILCGCNLWCNPEPDTDCRCWPPHPMPHCPPLWNCNYPPGPITNCNIKDPTSFGYGTEI